MDDLPRQKLAELIRHYGREVAGDARRCEALLKDYCPQHKKEVFALISAAKESVGVELLGSADGVPKEVVLSRLTNRVHENLGLPANLARWAVESWALALGLASLTDFRFPFKCPGCSAAGTMPTRLAGQKVTCPKCKMVLRVSEDGRRISVEVARSTTRYSAETVSAQGSTATVTKPIFDEEDDLLSEFPRVSAEEIFRQTLRRVLDDGIVTDEERTEVRKVQGDLGITPDVAAKILEEVKQEMARRGQPIAAGGSQTAVAAKPTQQPRRKRTNRGRTQTHQDSPLHRRVEELKRRHTQTYQDSPIEKGHAPSKGTVAQNIAVPHKPSVCACGVPAAAWCCRCGKPLCQQHGAAQPVSDEQLNFYVDRCLMTAISNQYGELLERHSIPTDARAIVCTECADECGRALRTAEGLQRLFGHKEE